MAIGPEVGVAYVIIRADTKRLAGDVGDGIKDIDTDKAGKDLGGSLGESTGSAFGPPFSEGVGDSVKESFNDPDHKKEAQAFGKRNATDHREGFENENKKKNPFASLTKDFKKHSKELTTNWVKLFKGLGVLAAPEIAGGLLTALGGLLAGATEIIGFLATAAAGAGVAMGGIFAAALPAAGLLFAALKTNTEQLKKFKSALEPIGEEWKVVAEAVQENLLPGLLDMLDATTDLIPIFKDVGKTVGVVGGNFFKMAGYILTTEKNVGPLNKILWESAEFFRLISEAALIVFDALLPLFSLMTPLAVQFAGSLREMAEHFNAFVTAGTSEGGTLGEKFQTWYDRLAQVFRIVGDLGVLFWNIFTVAADAGAPLFDAIEKTVQTWRDWSASEEGKNWLKEWFEAATPFLKEVWGLLKDIGEMVLGPIFDKDFSKETETVKTLREDWVPLFKELKDALVGTGIGDALFKLAESLVKLIASFAGSSTIVETIEGLASAIGVFADILGSSAVSKIAPTLATIYGSIKVFKLLGLSTLVVDLYKLGSAFVDFGVGVAIAGTEAGAAATGFTGLGITLAPFVVPVLAVVAAIGALIAIWVFWDEIIAGLSAAWDWFTRLSLPLKIIVGALTAFVLVIAAIFAGPIMAVLAILFAIVAVFKNWEAIVGFLDTVWDAIWEFFTKLPELLGQAWDAVVSFIEDLPSKLLELMGVVGEFFTGLGETIGEFFTGLVDSIGSFASGLVEGIGDFFTELPGNIKDALMGALEALPGLILDGLGALGNLGADIIGLIADGLAAALPALAEFFITLPFTIIGWIGEAFNTIMGIGTNIIQFIVEALVAALPVLADFFLNLPFEIIGFVGTVLKELTGIGIDIIQFIIEGLVQWLPEILFFFLKLPFEILILLKKGAIELVKFGIEMIKALLRGFMEALPRIIDWFKDLPGNIVSGTSSALTWLLKLGKDIIQGVWNGIQSAWSTVFTFFTGLPSRILGYVTSAATWLRQVGSDIINGMWQAIQSAWDQVASFFTNLPGTILGFLGDVLSWLRQVGSDLINGMWQGIQEFWDTVLEFFGVLPQTIWDKIMEGVGILTDIGVQVVTAILEGITSIAQDIWDWIIALPQTLWDNFILGLETLWNIGKEVITNILIGIAQIEQDIWDWITGLPSALWTEIKTALTDLWNIGKEIVTNILIGIYEIESDIWDWITGLPSDLWNLFLGMWRWFTGMGEKVIDWIVEGLKGLGSAIWEALKKAWNWAADKFSINVFGVEIKAPTFDVDGNEMGAIVPGSPYGQFRRVAENNRPEAIIPITHPAHALALMRESGLDQLVLAHARGTNLDTAAVAGAGAAGATMLAIHNATFQQPVDADMMAQKVFSAFRRLAS